MSFSTPQTWTNALVTPDDFNREIRDNFKAVQRVLARKTTQQEVVSSAASTEVFSANIPANTLGTNQGLRLTLLADHINNTGASRSLTLGILLGGNTVAGGGVSITNGANRSAQKVECIILAADATNAQRAWTEWTWGDTTSNNAAGGFALTGINRAVCSQHLALDSTGVLGLQVTIQHGLSSVSLSWRLLGVTLELLTF